MLGLTTTGEVLLIGLAVWLTVGVTLAVLMGRRGHNPFDWFLLGAILGPIALPSAWIRIKAESGASGRSLIAAVPEAGHGPVDVLIGIDGIGGIACSAPHGRRDARAADRPHHARERHRFRLRKCTGGGRHERGPRDATDNRQSRNRRRRRDDTPVGSAGGCAFGSRSERGIRSRRRGSARPRCKQGRPRQHCLTTHSFTCSRARHVTTRLRQHPSVGPRIDRAWIEQARSVPGFEMIWSRRSRERTVSRCVIRRPTSAATSVRGCRRDGARSCAPRRRSDPSPRSSLGSARPASRAWPPNPG